MRQTMPTVLTRTADAAPVKITRCAIVGARHGQLPAPLSAKDVPVIEAMKALSAQYPRYGDPSLTIFRGRR